MIALSCVDYSVYMQYLKGKEFLSSVSKRREFSVDESQILKCRSFYFFVLQLKWTQCYGYNTIRAALYILRQHVF